jgi:hypothetical protein
MNCSIVIVAVHFIQKEKETMVEPIRPSQVADRKKDQIPDVVIEVFNRQIAEKFDGHEARLVQDEIVDLLVGLGFSSKDISERHLLDIGDIFRKAGWNVAYDKPGFNETYPACFIFRKSRKRN